MRLLLILAAFGWGAVATAAQPACDVGKPCTLSSGEYYLAFPGNWNGKDALPAVLFFHGHGSTGESVIKSKGLRAAFARSGYLIIAPTGSSWPGHKAIGWPARLSAEGRRDDIAFVYSVLEDVAQRVPLDRGRVLVSGFSSGASMAWHMACHGAEKFSGYAVVAGALRRPTPQVRCPAGPFRLLHIHGFVDKQVPLEGRGIRDWHQGDVFESLALLRETNKCRSNPTRFESSGGFQCRVWDNCASGSDVQFCLHSGGHSLPRGWAARALEWFERGAPGS